MSEDEGRIGTKGPAHWIIPNTFHPSRRTDVYNINTIPKGMFKMHHTCALYWGKIQVISGRMEYVVYEAEKLGILEDESYLLNEGETAILYPQAYHHVTPLSDDLQFFIQFYSRK